ncbi:MAG TPA: ABC transporter permease [Terriglobales bacterium]|nr:ABC transporter permease [Terriglobales bacterium]
MIAYEHRSGLLYVPDDTLRVPVDVVSPNYFTALGVNARLGRVFAEQKTGGSNEPTGVVISDGLWRQHFGGDPAVVGTKVLLRSIDVTILGVMPRAFRGVDLQEPAAVWLSTDVGRGFDTDAASNPVIHCLLIAEICSFEKNRP